MKGEQQYRAMCVRPLHSFVSGHDKYVILVYTRPLLGLQSNLTFYCFPGHVFPDMSSL